MVMKEKKTGIKKKTWWGGGKRKKKRGGGGRGVGSDGSVCLENSAWGGPPPPPPPPPIRRTNCERHVIPRDTSYQQYPQWNQWQPLYVQVHYCVCHVGVVLLVLLWTQQTWDYIFLFCYTCRCHLPGTLESCWKCSLLTHLRAKGNHLELSIVEFPFLQCCRLPPAPGIRWWQHEDQDMVSSISLFVLMCL